MTSAAWYGYGYAPAAPNRPSPGRCGQLFRMYFANLPLPEEYIRHVDDEDGNSDFFQINTQAGREWHLEIARRAEAAVRSQGDSTPGPPTRNRPASPPSLIDWTIGYTTLGPDQETRAPRALQGTVLSQRRPAVAAVVGGPHGGPGPHRSGTWAGRPAAALRRRRPIRIAAAPLHPVCPPAVADRCGDGEVRR